jgi:predicted Co/Zn/Cd cation transporter (cation efflux family)
MSAETILVLILIFLIIIAIQNSARGGMQADHLTTIIYMLNSTRGAVEYLAKRQRILDRNNNFDHSLIVKDVDCIAKTT